MKTGRRWYRDCDPLTRDGLRLELERAEARFSGREVVDFSAVLASERDHFDRTMAGYLIPVFCDEGIPDGRAIFFSGGLSVDNPRAYVTLTNIGAPKSTGGESSSLAAPDVPAAVIGGVLS